MINLVETTPILMNAGPTCGKTRFLVAAYADHLLAGDTHVFGFVDTDAILSGFLFNRDIPYSAADRVDPWEVRKSMPNSAWQALCDSAFSILSQCRYEIGNHFVGVTNLVSSSFNEAFSVERDATFTFFREPDAMSKAMVLRDGDAFPLKDLRSWFSGWKKARASYSHSFVLGEDQYISDKFSFSDKARHVAVNLFNRQAQDVAIAATFRTLAHAGFVLTEDQKLFRDCILRDFEVLVTEGNFMNDCNDEDLLTSLTGSIDFSFRYKGESRLVQGRSISLVRWLGGYYVLVDGDDEPLLAWDFCSEHDISFDHLIQLFSE